MSEHHELIRDEMDSFLHICITLTILLAAAWLTHRIANRMLGNISFSDIFVTRLMLINLICWIHNLLIIADQYSFCELCARLLKETLAIECICSRLVAHHKRTQNDPTQAAKNLAIRGLSEAD